jgi:hypothetical protein
MKLCELNFEKQIGYLNFSQKNTQFQKINQLKRSLGSELISILNSTVFKGFSEKAAIFIVIYYSTFLAFFVMEVGL